MSFLWTVWHCNAAVDGIISQYVADVKPFVNDVMMMLHALDQIL